MISEIGDVNFVVVSMVDLPSVVLVDMLREVVEVLPGVLLVPALISTRKYCI